MSLHPVEQRALKADEVELLASFLHCDVQMAELHGRLDTVLQFDFTAPIRKLDQRFLAPTPGIRVEFSHIDHAVALQASGLLSSEDIERWASFLLLCDAYAWEGPEEEAITARLHALSAPSNG